MIPSLAALRIRDRIERRRPDSPRHAPIYKRWLAACNGLDSKQNACGRIPLFTPWKRLDSNDKMQFHKTIDLSENDRYWGGQYETPYDGKDVDRVLSATEPRDKWSVEHVVPRSKINGRAPGRAENDWLGWDLATRGANSERGNLPLVLWPSPSMPVGRVQISGDRDHFNPIEEHKDRLARRWMFVRATYSPIERISEPSNSQKKHADTIIELCSTNGPSYAEERLHLFLVELAKREFGIAWTNPLIDKNKKHEFLKDDEFKKLVFGP